MIKERSDEPEPQGAGGGQAGLPMARAREDDATLQNRRVARMVDVRWSEGERVLRGDLAWARP